MDRRSLLTLGAASFALSTLPFSAGAAMPARLPNAPPPIGTAERLARIAKAQKLMREQDSRRCWSSRARA